MVVELELALIAISSFSAQIHHNIQESYERVRKCQKVKGRVELKIDKTQSKGLKLVTISPNYTIPGKFSMHKSRLLSTDFSHLRPCLNGGGG